MHFLHRIGAIFIAISILAFTWSQLNIIVSFKIHQEYIAEVLCINKDKPEMKCEGKCHLKKELKKDEERKQQKTTVHEGFQVIFSPLRLMTLQMVFDDQQNIDTPYLKKEDSISTGEIFHPPKV